MEIEFNKSNQTQTQQSFLVCDEPANLKKISDVDNHVNFIFDDLVICNARDNHLKDVAELWANLASIQHFIAPDKYSFWLEEKSWHFFVRQKLERKNNLLLIAHKVGNAEVRGFLYLQTITIPSSDLILKGVIEDIYTKPCYRKEHIATKLLNTALEWAQTQNIKQVDFISLVKAKDLADFYLNFVEQYKKNIKLKLITV